MQSNYNDYADGGVHKEFHIQIDGVWYGNDKLLQESIRLEEALCSEQNIRFGACEAAQISFKIANDFSKSIVGKTLYVYISQNINGASHVNPLGYFKIKSDKPTADRLWREITAYDAIYDILNADVLDWYNGLTFPMTVKAFRDSFFTHLGITQQTQTLINDAFEIEKGFNATGSLSGKTIINAICEFNGSFGHMHRNGQFQYKFFTGSAFVCPPYENGTVTYEDYECQKITKVTMKGSSDDVGTSSGTDGNEYIIIGNPLIYGKEGTAELQTAVNKLLDKVSNFRYTPFSVGKTIGNPAVEVGDKITINTRNAATGETKAIVSYVLRRVLTGIQALRDNYSATGDEKYPVIKNSINEELQRVAGKTNELNRTVERTVSIVTELGETVDGQSSSISTLEQDAKKFVLSVDSNGNVAMMKLENAPNASSNFKVIADNINLDGSQIILNGTRGITISSPNFKVTKQGIATMTGADITGKIHATQLILDNKLSATDDITGLATVATSGSYNDLTDTPTIPSTELFVTKDGLIGSQPADGSEGFIVSSLGLLEASNAVIYGTIFGSQGKIGGLNIQNNSISSGGGTYTVETTQWTACNAVDGVSGHDGFCSFSNWHQKNSVARVTIRIKGYDTFAIYIRSDGESSYDYVVAGKLDATNINVSSQYQAKTMGHQKENISAIYTGLGGNEHTIELIYSKDGSGDYGADRGYFFVDVANCVDTTVNDSFKISALDFPRTIGGQALTNLRMAVGSNFGIDNSGKIYANEASITGTVKTGTGTNFVELKNGNITMGTNSSFKAVLTNSPYAEADLISFVNNGGTPPTANLIIGHPGYINDITLDVGKTTWDRNINLKGNVYISGYYMGRKEATPSTSSPTVDSTFRSIMSTTLPTAGTYVVTAILHTATQGNLLAGVGTSSGSSTVTQRASDSDWLTITRIISVTASTTIYLVAKSSVSTTAASGTKIEYVKVN